MSDLIKTLVGFRPSGRLHLGHLFSVIIPALENEADVLIADLHVSNVEEEDISHSISILERFLIPTNKIHLQSEIFDHKMFHKLSEKTTKAELDRLPNSKPTLFDYLYPIKMAVDIIGYDMVIVGGDQKPHLQLATDILYKCNINRPIMSYNDYLVRDLRDPSIKMSKSSPFGCIFLDDDYITIEEKIKKADYIKDSGNNLLELSNKFESKFDMFKMNKTKLDLASSVFNKLRTMSNGAMRA